MWAVQALAQPADVQPTLFPPFVVVADELALEFDHWRRVAEGQAGAPWSPGQRAAVAALDRLLSEMSGPGKPEVWLEPGCLGHPLVRGPAARPGGIVRLRLADGSAPGWSGGVRSWVAWQAEPPRCTRPRRVELIARS